jgi:hypothetical protein
MRRLIVGALLSLTSPLVALRYPEEGSHLPRARLGCGGIVGRYRFILPQGPRFFGTAIAAALTILWAGAPQVLAKPVLQSLPLLIDVSAPEAEDAKQTDGPAAGLQLFTPGGIPVLSLPAQDVQQLGLNLLRPPATGWAPNSQLEPSGSQETLFHSETLEQILRSIATVHPQIEPQGSPLNVRGQQGGESRNDGGQDQSVSELFLRSEIAGAALRAVVDLRTLDAHGATFSILGMGDFELNAVSGTHDVTLSELSNGWSATISGFADPNGVRYAFNSAQVASDGASPRPRPNLLRLMVTWVLDFLASPIGILITILSGLVLMVWVAISALRVVRATPSRHRRLRRARPIQGESTSKPRRKRRIVFSGHRTSRRQSGKRAPQA